MASVQGQGRHEVFRRIGTNQSFDARVYLGEDRKQGLTKTTGGHGLAKRQTWAWAAANSLTCPRPTRTSDVPTCCDRAPLWGHGEQASADATRNGFLETIWMTGDLENESC